MEETVVTPPVRPKVEIGSCHAEGAAQARMGEGIPFLLMVAVNIPVPGVTEGGDTEGISLAGAPLALPSARRSSRWSRS